MLIKSKKIFCLSNNNSHRFKKSIKKIRTNLLNKIKTINNWFKKIKKKNQKFVF